MNRECPRILSDLKVEMLKLEGEVQPIKTFFGLSNNKLIASLLGTLIVVLSGWLITEVRQAPPAEKVQLIESRQQDVLKRLAAHDTALAVTDTRLKQIEETVVETKATTTETNAMVRQIVNTLVRK